MNTKLMRTALTLVILLGAAIAVNAQPAATPKPVVFTTAPKLAIAKLKNSETDVYDVRGKITYTLTAANSDDTLAGTINYTIPDDARQKIAAMTGKPLASVPSSITRKDVVSGFQKATAPPIIHLEINPLDIDVAGAKLYFNRIQLDINARDSGGSPKFSIEEMEVFITKWAQQILAGRARRGIIAAMNRRIAGEDDN